MDLFMLIIGTVCLVVNFASLLISKSAVTAILAVVGIALSVYLIYTGATGLAGGA